MKPQSTQILVSTESDDGFAFLSKTIIDNDSKHTKRWVVRSFVGSFVHCSSRCVWRPGGIEALRLILSVQSFCAQRHKVSEKESSCDKQNVAGIKKIGKKER